MNLSAVKTGALRAYEKAALMGTTGAVMLVGAMPAHASIDTLFDEIDLSGVAAKVTAAAVVIVGIAFLIKGPSVVKRLISKI